MPPLVVSQVGTGIYIEDRRGGIPPGFNGSAVAEGQREG